MSNPQYASANEEATSRIRNNSKNELLYIVRAEEPLESGLRVVHYVCLNFLSTDTHVQFTGFEASSSIHSKFEKKTDALEYVKKTKSSKIVDVMIPWQKIVTVENRSASINKHKGVKNGK